MFSVEEGISTVFY